jgi:hypothetical protein
MRIADGPESHAGMNASVGDVHRSGAIPKREKTRSFNSRALLGNKRGGCCGFTFEYAAFLPHPHPLINGTREQGCVLSSGR